MKKFFLFALAAAFAFTSCTKDETIAITQPGAIAFAPAVDNATRAYVDPSFNTNNLENFNVYGYVSDGTTMGLVFSEAGEKVTKANGLWSYQNTQYWTKNMYYFSAIAPVENRNWQLTNATTDEAKKLGVGTVQFTNNGTQDLLYWFGTANGAQEGVQEQPVHIAFDHLLSKVKFTFENVFDNDQVSLVVKDVQITNAETSAFINLAVADKGWKDAWDFTNGTKGTFSFGNAAEASETAEEHIAKNKTLSSNKEMLLFPVANKEFKISFIVDIYMGELKASTSTHEVSVNTTLEMGKAYNFKAVLSGESEQLNPITFDVEVKPWEQEVEVNLNKAVRSADELLAAVADTTISEIVLADNINLETQALVINRGLTINLNDKTITGGLFAESNGAMNAGNTDSYVFWVQEGGELTINGAGNVKTQSCAYSIAVWAQGGEVVINGGYYENAGEGSDLIYASAAGKVTINGGTFKACEKQEGVDGTKEKYSAINLKGDGTNSSAVVYGGEFYKFNPAVNKSENPPVSFVAEGYTVKQNGDWYEVVKQ